MKIKNLALWCYEIWKKQRKVFGKLRSQHRIKNINQTNKVILNITFDLITKNIT